MRTPVRFVVPYEETWTYDPEIGTDWTWKVDLDRDEATDATWVFTKIEDL